MEESFLKPRKGSAMKHIGTTPRRAAFTLVELLVVIGIIALLIAMLMPSLAKARRQAVKIACQSNLRQVGYALIMYAQDNKGFMFPVGPPNLQSGKYPKGYGTQLPPEQRWPVYVFRPAVPNPKEMVCPADPDLGAEDLKDANNAHLTKHSYILNMHLVYEDIRYSRTHKINASDIVVMGEKKTEYWDYSMELYFDKSNQPYQSDFDRLVELYRHGLQFGSNTLFLDGHVDSRLLVKRDPSYWDTWQAREVQPVSATTQPSP